MSQFFHFAEEIKAISDGISNEDLGKAVKARIAKEHPAPTPYDIHGLPDPMNTDMDISDQIREKAEEIITATAGEQKALMIQYVRRSAPVVSQITLDVHKGKISSKTMRGVPIGVMVAFLDDDKLFVGWSKYNLKKEKDEDGKPVFVNGKAQLIEKLVFTKKDAIKTAILRALTDQLNVKTAPFKIADAMSAFVARTEKYFQVPVSNTDNTVGFA